MNNEKNEDRWNTTVKIQGYLAKKIDNILKAKGLNYRSRSDFVIKAVEKEIKEAILMNELTDAGKIIFEDLLCHNITRSYIRAKDIANDLEHPESIDDKIKLNKNIIDIED